ncbi:MAG: PEP-utilizing enzyme [Deltaproteobacteria bacterium]|nr:PEP-utilizing enzyme [Deltaproteobacteria bacterium]
MTGSLFQRFKGIVGGKQNRVPDLTTRFKAFQAMLDGNNRTLEAMTEMGEKLGGDYLFDINYIQSAYARLLAAISDSLSNFTRLTDNHYPQLVAILARIDGQVQRMLASDGSVSNRLVVIYPEITWDLAAEVGGKNYHLAELANTLHLRVPEAFAITTAAFTAFLRHNGLEERLNGLGQADSTTLAQLRGAILAGGFPDDFTAALSTTLETMRSRLGRNGTLAVRSSAEEEDGEFSFAGQFETVLNVPCTLEAVQAAYKEVVASLFQAGATSYQRQLGYDLGKLKMAVGCVAMVEAKASGVIYTAAAGKDRSKMAISAAWGLGKGVVDGLTDADLYTVTKGDKLQLVERHIGGKAQMVVNCGAIGIETRETPAELRDLACLSEAEVLELARQALTIEEHFKTPQDIEWAMDKAGRYYLLQARALRMDDPAEEEAFRNQEPAPTDYPVLLRNQGVVVQRGAAAGKVFILHHLNELEKIPQGSVLVASHDSPHFVQAIPFLHAIITDVGVPTSHMASICREFNLPTVVNTGQATALLTHGQEITLQAGEGSEFVVYAGIVQSLLQKERQTGAKLRELYEFRRQKYIMRHIAPLNLINPLEQEFSPEKCRTVHDLIRFMHEKAVQALVAYAEVQGRGLARFFGGKTALHRLTLPIPVQLLLIDLGGGLQETASKKEVDFTQVGSVPLRAVLAGMLFPGVWQKEGVALQGRDLLSGMIRAADITNGGDGLAGYNVALASREYMNMSLRFGYHFNMLDSYCSDKPRNNHIYFRFVGGAAAITNRSRRIALMAQVLAEHGFALKAKGDLLIGRLSGLNRQEIEGILEQMGRLIGYTRQLDARLDSDEMVSILARRFLAGDYHLEP